MKMSSDGKLERNGNDLYWPKSTQISLSWPRRVAAAVQWLFARLGLASGTVTTGSPRLGQGR
jgi:hypothetical protein